MQQPKCKWLKAQSQQSVLIIGRPSDARGKRTIRIILLFAVGEAVTIFDANTVGPRSYIRMYDSYRDILTGDTLRHQGQSRRSLETILSVSRPVGKGQGRIPGVRRKPRAVQSEDGRVNLMTLIFHFYKDNIFQLR